jgi:hypothetical protein
MLLSILLALSGAGNTYKVEVGRATVYHPGDGNCGGFRADGKPFTKEDDHIAHRFLPLHTSGVLCNLRTRRCVRTTVRDRGPFGAILPCSKDPSAAKGIGKPRKIRWMNKCWWYHVQTRLQDGWSYRGTFDLTKPVARAIGHQAFDRVVYVFSSKVRTRRRLLDSRRTSMVEASFGLVQAQTKKRQDTFSF